MTDNLRGNLWPTDTQVQLLRAATGERDVALPAFFAWRGLIDLDAEFEPGAFRLLPLLYVNMQRHGLSDNLMGRLKGTYRMGWCEIHQHLARARTVLSAFNEKGVRTLLIKGLPLSLRYYDNPAVRPMADLDIVVPHEQVQEAFALLRELGWTEGPYSFDEDIRFHHARQWFHPQGGELDLHWHVMQECSNAACDAHFWTGAESLDVDGVATLQFSPTDALFHAVIHGVRWNREPPIRWIADAITIIRVAGGKIDWNAMVQFAMEQRLTHRLALGLGYLRDAFGAPIPADIVECLRKRRISLLERTENTVALHDSESLYSHPVWKNWVLFARYCRIHNTPTPLHFVSGFSHYLRVHWDVQSRSQMGGVIVRGLLRRAGLGKSGRWLPRARHD
ncbi:MAG: nucleotidyltransferase family protein [Rhizomicrobium sp.]